MARQAVAMSNWGTLFTAWACADQVASEKKTASAARNELLKSQHHRLNALGLGDAGVRILISSPIRPQPPEPSGLEPSDDNSGLPIRWNLKDLNCLTQRRVLIGGGHKAKKPSAPSTNDMDRPTGHSRSHGGCRNIEKAGVIPNQRLALSVLPRQPSRGLVGLTIRLRTLSSRMLPSVIGGPGGCFGFTIA
jgi:hypothetical protein